jgi:hypothetical protein
MTEAEWLSGAVPWPLLAFVRDHASNRKQWLYAVGCCRRHEALFAHLSIRPTIETAERYADGLATGEELDRAYAETSTRPLDGGNVAFYAIHAGLALTRDLVRATAEFPQIPPARWAIDADEVSGLIAEAVISLAVRDGGDTAGRTAAMAERAAQTHLLREIIGNPFSPVAFDPSWRTSTAVALAEGIYADRAFDRLPILADALEDAGCDAAELLAHLRGDGPHVRGCWALDLVLGKS